MLIVPAVLSLCRSCSFPLLLRRRGAVASHVVRPSVHGGADRRGVPARPRRPSRGRRAAGPFLPVLLTAIFTVWAAATALARYGNSGFDMFTQNESTRSQRCTGSLRARVLVSAAHPTPWRHHHYTDFRYTTFEEVCRDVRCRRLHHCGAGPDRRGRTRRDGPRAALGEESLRMQGSWPPDLASIETAMRSMPYVGLVYENADARLYSWGCDREPLASRPEIVAVVGIRRGLAPDARQRDGTDPSACRGAAGRRRAWLRPSAPAGPGRRRRGRRHRRRAEPVDHHTGLPDARLPRGLVVAGVRRCAHRRHSVAVPADATGTER